MVVPGGGYFLNNRMPYYGLEPDDVNVLEPGKRTRHTINPALAMKDGRPYLAWNTRGRQPAAGDAAGVPGGGALRHERAAGGGGAHGHQLGLPCVDVSGTDEGMLTMPEVLYQGAGEALAALGHRVEVSPLQQPYRSRRPGPGR